MQTEIMVEAEIEMMLSDGKVERFILPDIPCTWVWSETSRHSAEYWAALDHVSNNYKYDWITVKSWVGSPVKRNKNAD